MKQIESKTFDEERALYALEDTEVKDCTFSGPADGESPLKEAANVVVKDCFFDLRYPFWHDDDLTVENTELSPLCRAALWYSRDVKITDSRLYGIKALRECQNVTMKNCSVCSPEFGWNCQDVRMENTRVTAEYFMMRCDRLHMDNVSLDGKYSFQYITDSEFESCHFSTKDAFWHARNVTVRNSVLRGEYLAWYSENLTLENCIITGTQPFCYCRNLVLKNCRMIDTDLAFERSDVQADIITGIDSVKNPLSGTITADGYGEIIFDLPEAKGQVLVRRDQD